VAVDHLILCLEIADDVTKCCSGCHKRILRKVEQLLCGELDEELAAHLSSYWSPGEHERLRAVVVEIGTDKWEIVAGRLGVDRSANDCRVEFEKLAAELRLDKTPTAKVQFPLLLLVPSNCFGAPMPKIRK
jgi:hypothetical protein